MGVEMEESQLVAIEWKRWERQEGRVPRCYLSVIVASHEPTHNNERRYRVMVEIAGGAMAARVTHRGLGREGRIWIPWRCRSPKIAEHVVSELRDRVGHLTTTA
jgi:hypothetical protein